MDRLKDFKDYLYLPYLCARLIGVDPTHGRDTFRFKLSCLAIILGVINHIHVMIGEFVYFYKNRNAFSSLLEATKTAAYIAYGINTNTKIGAVLSNLTRLRNVLQTTERLYPKTDKEKQAYRVNENFWPRYIYMMVGQNLFAGWIVYFLPGIKSLYEYLVYGGEFSFETPFYVDHGFDYRSWLRYCLVYFSELWGGHLCVCSNIGIDVVMCCLSRQMSMHLKYIGQEIEQYWPTGKAEDCVFIAKLIERHQLILKLCYDLNKIFSASLVFDFISLSGIICLSAFQVTVEGSGIELAKFFLMCVSSLLQLFIISYFGDELITCSTDIAQSVYNHPWYRGNASYKKHLVVFILRCQKPAKITAIGFSTVCLETFKQVTSMSYRIFALLQTFNSAE